MVKKEKKYWYGGKRLTKSNLKKALKDEQKRIYGSLDKLEIWDTIKI